MSSPSRTQLHSAPFGTLPEGAPVEQYTLRSDTVELDLIGYGARVVALRSPDSSGTWADVALGYGELAPYVQDGKSYLGCVVGRYANRLAGGRFALDGLDYQVPVNNAPNALHGGPQGFDQRLWDANEIEGGVEFTLVSADGDQGFPGELTATVRYTLTDNIVRLEYVARSSKPTVLNLTNHAYFNLLGEGSGDVLQHEVRLEADHFTPVDEALIPVGDLAPVTGGPFDFTTSRRIGDRIDAADEQLHRARGYDHNWVVRGKRGTLRPCAEVFCPASGRRLVVQTTEPGVQFYTGNFLDGTHIGKRGRRYEKRGGLCLETQHYPDSPNQPAFPSTILRPGETFTSSTTWTLDTP